MTDTNLFSDNSATTTVTEPATTPAAPVLPDEVAGLVGAGKKYASVEDALKALPHAQAHIARIEEENKALREKAAQARALEDVYEALTSRQTGGEATPPVIPVLDETMLDSVLERKLQEKQALEQRNKNLATVKDSLTGKFGEKAPEVFGNKAKELGVNEAFLTDLAAKSPAAALELFGLAKKEAPPPTAISGGSINTQALGTNKPAPQFKPVMGGAKTDDVLAAWRALSPTNTQ